jgi:glutamate synthase (NADPH/NADH) small chain
MPVREPEDRTHDFEEVKEDFCFSQAMSEAERCLRCQDPACIDGCPVRVPIADFIHAVAADNLPRAAALLREANPLAAICGRVCPQESQCEMKCHMARRFGPVPIGKLERYVSDWEMSRPFNEEVSEPWREEKVAVVGSGPSGLVCAGELARLGYHVTVYEALQAPGGALRYGIPEFRLPNSILDWEIASLERLGVRFVNEMIIGKTIKLDHLFSEMGYSAAFIGAGAGLPNFMGIPGESLNGVYSANEFLTRINLMQAFGFLDEETPLKVGSRVAVIGSDDTAMDAVRSALRLGAEKAMVVYRSTENEMTARIEEYEHATEEGVEFHWLTNPIEVLGDRPQVHALGTGRTRRIRACPAGADRRFRVHIPCRQRGPVHRHAAQSLAGQGHPGSEGTFLGRIAGGRTRSRNHGTPGLRRRGRRDRRGDGHPGRRRRQTRRRSDPLGPASRRLLNTEHRCRNGFNRDRVLW